MYCIHYRNRITSLEIESNLQICFESKKHTAILLRLGNVDLKVRLRAMLSSETQTEGLNIESECPRQSLEDIRHRLDAWRRLLSRFEGRFFMVAKYAFAPPSLFLVI